MRFLIIYILIQSLFLETALGRFNQCFILFFVTGQSWWPTFLLSFHQPPVPLHEKLPTAL